MKRITEKNKCKCRQCNSKEEIYPETKQKMVRPNLHIKRAMLFSMLMLLMDNALAYGTVKVLSAIDISIPLSFGLQFIVLFILFLIGTLILFAKRIVIFIIRLYQKYAPYDIRSNCLFVPNCSEYMILAIQKYGLLRGIKKGIHRYKRCHAPNGGVDYP